MTGIACGSDIISNDVHAAQPSTGLAVNLEPPFFRREERELPFFWAAPKSQTRGRTFR